MMLISSTRWCFEVLDSVAWIMRPLSSIADEFAGALIPALYCWYFFTSFHKLYYHYFLSVNVPTLWLIFNYAGVRTLAIGGKLYLLLRKMDPPKLESDLTGKSLMAMILGACVKKIMVSFVLVILNAQFSSPIFHVSSCSLPSCWLPFLLSCSLVLS